MSAAARWTILVVTPAALILGSGLGLIAFYFYWLRRHFS